MDSHATRVETPTLGVGPPPGCGQAQQPTAPGGLPWLPVAPGDVVASKYRVERLIGAGGMGVVLSAWHLSLNQRVALKFIRPGLARDADATARFLREARAAARLQSMHVGKVFDLDALPDGTPFVVMEHLEGESIEARLARERTLPVAVALGWTRQALLGLAEAHACGTVHLDVKPGNLFLARGSDGSEVVKLLDFGIAHSVDPQVEQGLRSASTQWLMGSPPFLAPEQLGEHGAVDGRADLWALGVVLYQLLSGRLPFEHDTLPALLEGLRFRAPRPLAQVTPGLPEPVLAIVERCLQKEPGARFQSATAMREAVEAALAGALPAPTQPIGRPLARRRVTALGGALFILAVAGGAGLLARRAPSLHHPTAVLPTAGVEPARDVPAREVAPAPAPEEELAPLPAPAPRRAPAARATAGAVEPEFEERR